MSARPNAIAIAAAALSILAGTIAVGSGLATSACPSTMLAELRGFAPATHAGAALMP